MCSTIIFGDNRNQYFAQNYDFSRDHGLIATNLRGTKKSNGVDIPGKVVSWTVKFGSVTINQFSLEFPVSGMNEAGLVIALMWHDEGDFGDGENVQRLNELQWIQYQLDNYSTVVEVIEGLSRIRPERGPIPLHYSILDANGDHVLVEFINGEPLLHENTAFPILTNSSYKTCLSAAQNALGAPDELGNSVGRFVRLYSMLNSSTDAPTENKGFEYLDAVNAASIDEQGFPWNQNQNDTVTAWSVVFNPMKKSLQIKTNQNSAIREMHLADINFDADGRYQLLDVHAGEAGDLTSMLEDYTKEKNHRLLSASVPTLGLPDTVADELAQVVDGLYMTRAMG